MNMNYPSDSNLTLGSVCRAPSLDNVFISTLLMMLLLLLSLLLLLLLLLLLQTAGWLVWRVCPKLTMPSSAPSSCSPQMHWQS
jgi:hypothetical protein